MRNDMNYKPQKMKLDFDESGDRTRGNSDRAENRSGGQRGGHNRKKKRNTKYASIAVDVAIAALIMLVFYVTNYGVHTESTGTQLSKEVKDTADALATAAQAATVDDVLLNQDPAETNSTIEALSWREKFADLFTDGTVEKTDTTYRSANISVSIQKMQQEDAVYFFADIYIVDIQYFKTAFAKKPDVMGDRELTNIVAKENNAILAINGDHCLDNNGPVVRNGKLYRDETFADALVLYNDGSMQTFSADQLDSNAIETSGAWQVWTFGPMLLKDGQPMTEFNSTLKKANPRTAVGYYEPGHYCFLVVDGRQPGYSEGMTLQELSQFFYDKGCKVAFNLDGGQSSEMAFMGEVVNQPYNGGRSTSDILYISDE